MDPLRQPTSHSKDACNGDIRAVKDALYVLSGKWKLPLILALTDGPKRFNELQRLLGDITPKVLTKELRELEQHEFVTREVYSTIPVTVTYQLTPYSGSLGKVLDELKQWGRDHRQRIMGPAYKE
ncbi:winged helix-turn-helix transcriptional regulator [Spirosoma pomorum]